MCALSVQTLCKLCAVCKLCANSVQTLCKLCATVQTRCKLCKLCATVQLCQDARYECTFDRVQEDRCSHYWTFVLFCTEPQVHSLIQLKLQKGANRLTRRCSVRLFNPIATKFFLSRLAKLHSPCWCGLVQRTIIWNRVSFCGQQRTCRR